MSAGGATCPRAALACGLAACLLSAAPAHGGRTGAPPSTGFENGLRLAFELPFGASTGDRHLSDDVRYRLPVWLDLGYRPGRALFVGLFAQTGLGSAGRSCADFAAGGADVQCSFNDVRVGPQVQLRPLGPGAVDLWVGGGLGYEWLKTRAQFALTLPDPDTGESREVQATVDATQSGADLLLDAGMDFELSGAVRGGPFVSYTLGQFVHQSFTCYQESCPRSGSVHDRSLHHWIALGVRGVLGP